MVATALRNGCYQCMCVPLGYLGFESLDKDRKRVFTVVGLLKVIATIFSVVACFGMSTDKIMLETFSWSYGEVKAQDATIYIGLFAYAGEYGNVSAVHKWEDQDCAAGEVNDPDMCSACKDSATGSWTTVVAGALTKVPGLLNILSRGGLGRPMTDSPRTKFMSVLTGLIQPIMLLSSMLSYSENCNRNLPDHLGEHSLNFRYGTGYIAVAIALAIDLFCAAVHIITPCPAGSDRDVEKLQDSSRGSEVAGVSVVFDDV